MISAQGLSYAYPSGQQVLKALDLKVPAGGRLAIVGANGVGKTTLLLLFNGILKPSAGELRIADQPVAYDRAGLKRWRSTVGLVLQDPDDQLFAGTVAEDVSFGPLNLGLDELEVRSRVERALVELDIEALAERPLRLLSAGEKHRVAIAGILAMTPRVLLLDEPTAGLDPRGTDMLLVALARLSAAGTTIILTTHDVDLAYGWADQVAVLIEGGIGIVGSPQVVFDNDDIVERASLRPPFLVDVFRQARRLGLVGEGELPVKSVDDLIARWQQACLTRDPEHA